MIQKASIIILIILISALSLTACSSDSDDTVSPYVPEQSVTQTDQVGDEPTKQETQEYDLYIENLAKGLLYGSYIATEDITAANAFMSDAMNNYDKGSYGLAGVYIELASKFYSNAAFESNKAMQVLQEAIDGAPSAQLGKLAQSYVDLCSIDEQLASMYQGACEYLVVAFDYYYDSDDEAGEYWANMANVLLEEEDALLNSYNNIVLNITKLDLQDVEISEYEAYIENLAKGLIYGTYLSSGDRIEADAFVNDAMQNYESQDYGPASVYAELAAEFYSKSTATYLEAGMLLQKAADEAPTTQLKELAQGYADLCSNSEQLVSVYQGTCEYLVIALNYYLEGDYEAGDYWFNMSYALLEEEGELLESYNDLINALLDS